MASYKDTIFDIFKPKYKIDLFYKPTGIEDDLFYHIILDSTILIILRYYEDTKVIILRDIMQLSPTGYIPSFYDTLVEFLKEQTNFTIVADRLGNTHVIDNACIRAGIPTLHNNIYSVIPKKLRQMYDQFYSSQPNKTGLYVFSVAKHTDMNKTPKELQEKPKPKKTSVNQTKVIEKVDMNDTTIPFHKKLQSIFTDGKSTVLVGSSDYLYSLIYCNMIKVDFKETVQEVRIMKIGQYENSVTRPSSIQYMQLFEKMEVLCEIKPMIINNVNTNIIYGICQSRRYIRQNIMMPSSMNSFGSFQMIHMK